MPYTPTTWADYPDTSTPITAAELQRIDDGVAEALTRISALERGGGRRTGTPIAIIEGVHTPGAAAVAVPIEGE